MAVNAYDVQVCLWKMLKLSSKTCVSVSLKHPYVSSSLLFLFLLYICFPLVFWILIYSLPLVVCTCIVLSISFSIRNGRKYKDGGEGDNGGNSSERTKFAADDCTDDKNKKPYSRVHSVRRRRAKEIMRDDDVQNNVEEKNAVSSTNFNCDMVDKNALIDESPKEIREVEVDFSLVNRGKDASSSASQGFKHDDNDDEESNEVRCLEILKDENEANKAMKGNEDDQKNVMDVGIWDAERNKRLESLIARRKSRKLLCLQVRRSLMNMDRNERSSGQIPSLIIPKISNSCSPSKIGGPFSPGPGSAPSVLIPLRNPFDLPYDPQEEKPDLTGDSFQQEFTSVNNRDVMFCRHESFSLGSSSPQERFQDREKSSLVHEFGFRKRGSPTGYQYSKPGDESDRGIAPQLEQESCEVSESKSNADSPDDVQIKEIIEVYENDTQNHSEEDAGEVETRQMSLEDFSSSSSSPSSSEEDQPILKINKEAILKSLSFMRRNALQEIENNERLRDNLSCANSALENASRLNQQYNADKTTRCYTASYSIASDLQVEVSEISSPPLAICENTSYYDEDVSTYEIDRNISEADDNDARSKQVNEANEQDIIDVGVSRLKKPEDTALSNSMEESLKEKHCIQSSCSNAEFREDGDDKILQDEKENQIEQYATTESSTGPEQLAAESMESSENSGQMFEVLTIVENHVNIEPVQHIENEQNSGEVSISQADDLQEQSLMPNVAIGQIQSPIISPKSVLLPTFSLSSFDPHTDEDVQQSGGSHNAEVSTPVSIPNSTASTEQTRDLPPSDGDAEVSQESSEPTVVFTIEADDIGSSNGRMKTQEYDEQPKEVSSNSSEMLGIREAPAPPRDETSSRSFIYTDEVSSKDFEAANPCLFIENIDHTKNSISSPSAEEDLSQHQEMLIGEPTNNDDRKPSRYEDQAENSAICEETGHERQTNSTNISFDEKEDEVKVTDVDETGAALSGLVESNDNFESWKKNAPDRKAEQNASSDEAMVEIINTPENE